MSDFNEIEIASARFFSAEHVSRAPNGCTAHTERIRRTVIISSAVFDGKREVFAHGFNNVVIEDRVQPRFGGWAEHHPERVADWRRRVEAANAPAPTSWHTPPEPKPWIVCT